MHAHSLLNMQRFHDRYLRPHLDALPQAATVVDIGSKDFNGSYRSIFTHEKLNYIGVDLEPGRGVDVICETPYAFPLPDAFADIVISGQTLEHSEFFWQAAREMVRVAKPGAYIVLIVPSKGYIHRYPVDCYRFLPDSMPALAKYTGCRLLESWLDETSEWGDLVGVFLKPPLTDANRDAASDAENETAVHVHSGVPYIEYLQQAIQEHPSRAHLEIGTRTGTSIAGLSCPTIAVDPEFRLNTNPVGNKPACMLFQQTSDAFFAQHDPENLLGRPLDTAFLDGMHHFENLLRDFINTERCCASTGAIYLHDCLPVAVSMTHRDEKAVAQSGPHAGWWTGDVWKLIPVLKELRPDLEISCLDCPPTGLVRIRKLDPGNTLLSSRYQDIIETQASQTLNRETLSRFLQDCAIQSSRA